MFDENTIPHSHFCECHVIRIDTLEDQNGKIWTQQEIENHLIDLQNVDEEKEVS